jgi:DNA-binding beta-propeller fold protein YncE
MNARLACASVRALEVLVASATVWAMPLHAAEALAAGVIRMDVQAEGLRLQVELRGVGAAAEPVQGGKAWLRVEVRSSADGAPLQGIEPLGWLDRHEGAALPEAACSRRIGSYASNGLTDRAWRDLTGYHVLVLNAEEGGISVLDPRTSFAGKTSLKATVPLPAAGLDWDLSARHDRLYVSVPQTRQLAVADLSTLGPPQLVALPGSPARVRLHPGGEQVWVGVPRLHTPRTNTGVHPGDGGVSVLATRNPSQSRWLATGDGHKEFAFDPDGLVAVTNRDSGSVVFVDPQSLSIERRVAVEGTPIAVVFAPREARFVVAEARRGALLRFDAKGREIGVPLLLTPGLGPMSLSPDGRWLLVLNPPAGRVHAVDLQRWAQAVEIGMPGRPFQLTWTREYAYVRSLDREDVHMIHWPSLGESGQARVQRFVAGEKPPGATPDLPLASQMSALPDGTGVFVASPSDAAVYTYVQGMNAPMSSATPRGHPLRAVLAARQGLLAVAPGVYEAEVQLPRSGQALLALATDRPRTRHCLPVELAAGDATGSAPRPLARRLSWNIAAGRVGDATRIEAEIAGVTVGDAPEELQFWVFQPGSTKRAVVARRSHEPLGMDGAVERPAGTGTSLSRVVYRAVTRFDSAGAYYVHVHAPPQGVVSAAMARQYGSFEVEP